MSHRLCIRGERVEYFEVGFASGVHATVGEMKAVMRQAPLFRSGLFIDKCTKDALSDVLYRYHVPWNLCLKRE